MRATLTTRFQAKLQSEKPLQHFRDKVVRQEPARFYWPHPTYVMSREKSLSRVWWENRVFGQCARFLVPVVGCYYVFHV